MEHWIISKGTQQSKVWQEYDESNDLSEMHVISEMCFVVRSSSVMIFIVLLFFMFHTSTARHAAWHVETTNLAILDCEVR